MTRLPLLLYVDIMNTYVSVSLALRAIYAIHNMYVDVQDADADVQIFEASR